MHSYCAFLDKHEYTSKMLTEAHKCRTLANQSQVFTILLITDFPYQLYDGPEGVLKYNHKMGRWKKQFAEHDMALRSALTEVQTWERFNTVGEIRTPGCAFERDVTAYYCLFGPY